MAHSPSRCATSRAGTPCPTSRTYEARSRPTPIPSTTWGGGPTAASTKPISAYNSITSTFSEDYPAAGSWDAAYDLWTNNWTNETMIWNQWAGSQAYWYPASGVQAITIDGVAYHFIANGSELIFMMVNQEQSGSANILAVWQWEVANGYAKSTDVPTQLEYGVEVCSTNGSETFPMSGLTFNVS